MCALRRDSLVSDVSVRQAARAGVHAHMHRAEVKEQGSGAVGSDSLFSTHVRVSVTRGR